MVDGKPYTHRPLSDEIFIVDGLHPAIIEKGLFDEVQALMSKNHAFPHTATGSRLTNPLAGLVVCAECGHLMRRKPARNDARRADAYLVCIYPKCPTIGIDFAVVEDAILDTLSDWLGKVKRPSDPDEKKKPRVDPVAVQRQAFTTRLEKLKAQKSMQMELLEQCVYTIEEYKERSASVQSQIEQAEADLAALHQKPTRTDAVRALAPTIEHVLSAYPNANTADEKNALLKSVIDHVVYSKTRQAKKYEDPSEMLTLDVWPVFSGDLVTR